MSAKPKKRPPIKPGPAAKKLQGFITDNGVSIRAASEALGVSHPALLAWLRGSSKPDAVHRKKIEVWTAGSIPEKEWMTADQALDLGKVEEFKPKPKTRAAS